MRRTKVERFRLHPAIPGGLSGLEEACAYFAYRNQASIEENPLAAREIANAIDLWPDASLSVSHAFGVVAESAGFGAVAPIRSDPGSVVLADREGREVFAACDPSFVTGAP
jgi:hypothetical protein